jgi:hypothetical protein
MKAKLQFHIEEKWKLQVQVYCHIKEYYFLFFILASKTPISHRRNMEIRSSFLFPLKVVLVRQAIIIIYIYI